MDSLLYHSIAAQLHSSAKNTQLLKYHFPDVYIPNRSLAWHLSALSPDSDELKELVNQTEEYNRYIDFLNSIPDFTSIFCKNNFCLSMQDAKDLWPQEIVARVFSLPNYKFKTQLCILHDCLIDITYEPHYSLFAGNTQIEFEIGSSYKSYPEENDNSYFLWGWFSDDLRDVTFSLWVLLDELKLLPEPDDDSDEPQPYGEYAFYDQARYDMAKPSPNLLRCIQLLQKYHYLTLYTVKPTIPHPLWVFRGKDDGSIDLAVLDKSFKQDRLLLEKMKLILAATEAELQEKKYFLTDSKNHQYLDSIPGVFGGHKRLKIYGKLDCASALRHIANGNYIRHRVFFKDEETAIQAGYRPCARCMPDAYRRWMINQNQPERNDQHD